MQPNTIDVPLLAIEDYEALPVGTLLTDNPRLNPAYEVTATGTKHIRTGHHYGFSAFPTRESYLYYALVPDTFKPVVQYRATGKSVGKAEAGDLVRVRAGQGKSQVSTQFDLEDGSVHVVSEITYGSVRLSHHATRSYTADRFQVVEEIPAIEEGSYVEATQTVAGLRKGSLYEVAAVHASKSIAVLIDGIERVIYPSEFKAVAPSPFQVGDRVKIIEGAYLDGDLPTGVITAIDFAKGWRPISALGGAVHPFTVSGDDGGNYYATKVEAAPEVPVEGDIEVPAYIADVEGLRALSRHSVIHQDGFIPFTLDWNGQWKIAGSTVDYTKQVERYVTASRTTLVHYGSGSVPTR